jgi:4-hydroxy-4-methyl-2-oxoglutarate aldolase
MESLVALLREYPVSTIYEALDGEGLLDFEFKSFGGFGPYVSLVGPAYTVGISGNETLAVIDAVSVIPKGSVLVIANGGMKRSTVFGGTSALACTVRGAFGCVTDGAVRDLEVLDKLPYPTFAASVSASGTSKIQAGKHGGEIQIGGQTVQTGDLIAADRDGIIVIRQRSFESLPLKVIKQSEKEASLDGMVQTGITMREALSMRNIEEKPLHQGIPLIFCL